MPARPGHRFYFYRDWHVWSCCTFHHINKPESYLSLLFVTIRSDERGQRFSLGVWFSPSFSLRAFLFFQTGKKEMQRLILTKIIPGCSTISSESVRWCPELKGNVTGGTSTQVVQENLPRAAVNESHVTQSDWFVCDNQHTASQHLLNPKRNKLKDCFS